MMDREERSTDRKFDAPSLTLDVEPFYKANMGKNIAGAGVDGVFESGDVVRLVQVLRDIEPRSPA
jgi:hypothetical protein